MKWEKEIDIYEGNENERFLLGRKGKNMLLVVGLNPSMANEGSSDRTMRRVEKIIENNGFDGFLMVNLYPQRTPKPDELELKKDNQKFDKNLKLIKDSVDRYSIKDVLFAYGNQIENRDYLFQTLMGLKDMFLSMNTVVIALNKSGHPRHPLYCKIGVLQKWNNFLEYMKKN